MSDFTGKKISNTYQRLLQLSDNKIADGTGSLVSLSEIRFSDGTTQITAGGGGATGGGVFVNKGGGVFELTESVSTALKIGVPLLPSDDKDVTIGSITKPFKEVFVDSGSLVVVSGSSTSSIQFLEDNLQFDSSVSASVIGELIGTSSFASTATTSSFSETSLTSTTSSFSTTAQTAVIATTSSFSETAQTADTADVATTAQNTFATMSVSGQTEILADSTRDVLNLSSSDNIKITSDDSTDTITFDLQDDVNVKTLTAETYIVSSSVTNMTTNFSSGSTVFGDTLDDTHNFTGSLLVTGSNLTAKVDTVELGALQNLTINIPGLHSKLSTNSTSVLLKAGSNGNLNLSSGNEIIFLKHSNDGNDGTEIGKFSNSQLIVTGDISASGKFYGDGSSLSGIEGNRNYNQESKIVDFSFISSRTASLDQTPIEHSENVFFNGLRLTKDSGSFEFDYSMSLNDKHIIFSPDITFKVGDFLSFQYEF